MAAMLPLWTGTGPSEWTTYAGVGIGVALVGTLVLFLAGGFNPPGQGLVRLAYLLSLFVVGLGLATLLASLVVRRRQGDAGPGV